MNLFDGTVGPGWFDWLGLLLAVAGFWIAIVQLGKTRSAADAAARELERARERLSGDQLSAVVAQLQSIVADVDFAVDNNDREVAHRALLRFSLVANESMALLGYLSSDHSALKQRLAVAAEAALDAKAAIVGKKNVDVARTAKAVGTEIGALTVEVSGLVAQGRYEMKGGSNV